METGLMNLDKKAYDIICKWPEFIGFNPIIEEIDYSHIIRFYLWDKVGRSLRSKLFSENNELKLYQKEYKNFQFYYSAQPSAGYFKKKLFDSRKRIFIPFQVPHNRKLIENLQKTGSYHVISKTSSNEVKISNVIKKERINYNPEHAKKLFQAVLEAMEASAIQLTAEDKELLQQQIKGSFQITALAEKELKKNKPHLLYVHSDNHPPYINYVLAAKKLGIPTCTYQHGLDCEQYLLDDCFADHIAVWSENRKEQYLKKSAFQPKSYAVIGNHLFNPLKNKISQEGSRNMLFITRPHRPIKCYSPYRTFTEGLDILKVIIRFMTLNPETILTIRPHPMDLTDLYDNEIKKSGLEDRISVSLAPLNSLINKSDIIITEDSTAGVESMYYELPCIFSHFTNSRPVIPFAESGAALEGETENELLSSLNKVFILTEEEKNTMKLAQRKLREELLPLGNVQNLTDFLISKL